jgi:hypothetical protein
MTYHNGSNWNDLTELKCLLIFKKLEFESFPRGSQRKLSLELEGLSNLKFSSITAKVSNYKTVAGVNKSSNFSINTKKIYENFGHLKVVDIEKVILKESAKHKII